MPKLKLTIIATQYDPDDKRPKMAAHRYTILNNEHEWGDTGEVIGYCDAQLADFLTELSHITNITLTPKYTTVELEYGD